ncbi:hypothetical protein [uncultured Bradyrhizobium sp.]|uniref:hypothetical protein n=1 Tax=uncultured Bradyrhizobium sp. TaxID=199684 RepID=UPI0035CC3F4D
MIDDDLRLRAKRLLDGQRRADDLDRFFLDLRERTHGRASFREIGDFVAHRGQRDKGPLTQIARDVITSVSVWSLGFRGKRPTYPELALAARANFRLASDKQLKDGCGLRRPAVKRILDAALPRLEVGGPIQDEELPILLYLGNRFIWKPAFTDEQVIKEFCDVLILNRIVSGKDRRGLQDVGNFIILHALARMHGTTIALETGGSAELLAGYANQHGHLEVKVQIEFNDALKPISSPVCMFLTKLKPEEHCDATLLAPADDYLASDLPPKKWTCLSCF